MMGNVHFYEFIAFYFVAEFFIKADGGIACMHDHTAVPFVPGKIFGKSHDGCTHTLPLQVVSYRHLSEAQCIVVQRA